jgi:hypothetical protein
VSAARALPQYRRQAVAEKDQVDEAPADRLSGEQRILAHGEPKHDGHQRQCRDRQRPDIVHHAAGVQAQPLQSDGHGEPDRYL